MHGAGLPPGEIADHGPDVVVPSGLLSDSTSLVLDATRWRDFVAAMLELHVRNPQGEREVVAMPWRLMASGHLAHANAMSGMPGQASSMGGAHPGAGMQAATAGASPGLSFMSPASSSPVFEGQGVPAAALHSQASSRTRDDVAALKTMSSHAPAAAEWLARWMKWIERDGRDAVVWLRDFLKAYQGGFIVISHDVHLVEETVNRVFYLDANRQVIDIYNMGWKHYLRQREADEERTCRR